VIAASGTAGARPEPADCSVGMLRANLLTIVAAGPLTALLAAAFAARWGAAPLVAGIYGLLTPARLLLLILPGIVAHELIHALAWAVAAGRPLSAIEVGVRWRTLSPYAHPRAPVTARAYRIGAAMPMLVLGLVPSLAAIALGLPALMAWALFFVFTAGGDLLVLWLIRRVPGARLLEDHADRVGCLVLPADAGVTISGVS
jgi:hypothetical protein